MPRRAKIYVSKLHLVVTIFVIIVPFLFLLIFSIIANLSTGSLFRDVLISAARIIIAYLIAAVLAWLSAVAFYRGRRAVIALPVYDVLQSFPTFAALPLAVHFWGQNNFTVIFFLVITIIWPIFFSTLSSLKLIKRDWQEAAEISGLHGFNYLRQFLLPVSIPGLITGSIIGIGEGWEALVATEIIIGMKTGLGNFFQSHVTSGAITTFGILGFLLLIFMINKLVWIPLLDRSHRTMEE